MCSTTLGNDARELKPSRVDKLYNLGCGGWAPWRERLEVHRPAVVCRFFEGAEARPRSDTLSTTVRSLLHEQVAEFPSNLRAVCEGGSNQPPRVYEGVTAGAASYHVHLRDADHAVGYDV